MSTKIHLAVDGGGRPVRFILTAGQVKMKRTRGFDARIYKKRNLVERAINKLKHFRRIATRYDRKVANFMAFLCLATLPVWCA